MSEIMLRPEVETWYILPFIKKSVTLWLKSKGYKQTEISQMMGITPASVSLYCSGKRASAIETECASVAKVISNLVSKELSTQKSLSPNTIYTTIAKTLQNIESKGIVCKIHKSISKENCCIIKDKSVC
jgi:predicted transcriptional regulator